MFQYVYEYIFNKLSELCCYLLCIHIYFGLRRGGGGLKSEILKSALIRQIC
jgi:hypothetical protein